MIRRLFSRLLIISLAGILWVMYSCTATEQVVSEKIDIEADNKYDSEFPVKNVSKELEFLSTTVKKLDCLAFYKSYVFSPDNDIKLKDINENVLKNESLTSTVISEAVSGTATVIYFDGNRIGLLTCAHVVDFPDTVIIRYENGKGPIEVISVKIKQQNFVKDLPSGDNVEVLATDQKNDIAILEKVLDDKDSNPTVLNYPLGNTRDFQWGSVVYVMGYPAGQLMVTTALVSDPIRARRGKFTTDALYNRGISGGPILAIRDGVPNFELVGIASSASAKQVFYLKPGKESPEFINPDEAFTGDLFVDQYKEIRYGVSFNISIEEITGFLNKNRSMLTNRGFDMDQFFK